MNVIYEDSARLLSFEQDGLSLRYNGTLYRFSVDGHEPMVIIRKLGEGEKDTSLVALIIGIAGSLKIPVVAEGVETGEQLQILRELGCTLVQGFYLSMPIPADQFEEKYIRKMQSSGEEER